MIKSKDQCTCGLTHTCQDCKHAALCSQCSSCFIKANITTTSRLYEHEKQNALDLIRTLERDYEKAKMEPSDLKQQRPSAPVPVQNNNNEDVALYKNRITTLEKELKVVKEQLDTERQRALETPSFQPKYVEGLQQTIEQQQKRIVMLENELGYKGDPSHPAHAIAEAHALKQDFDAERTSAMETVEKLRNDKGLLERQISVLKGTLHEERQEFHKKNAEMELMGKQMKQLQEQFDAEQQRSQRMRAEHDSELRMIEADLVVEKKAKQALSERLQSHKDTSNKTSENLERELEALRTDIDMERQAHTVHSNKLVQERDLANQRLLEKEASLTTLQSVLDREKHEKDGLLLKLKELGEQLVRDKTVMEAEIVTLKSELEAERSLNGTQIQRLQGTLDGERQAAIKLRAETEADLQATKTELLSERSTAENQIAKLQGMLDGERQASVRSRTQYEADIRGLKNEITEGKQRAEQQQKHFLDMVELERQRAHSTRLAMEEELSRVRNEALTSHAEKERTLQDILHSLEAERQTTTRIKTHMEAVIASLRNEVLSERIGKESFQAVLEKERNGPRFVDHDPQDEGATLVTAAIDHEYKSHCHLSTLDGAVHTVCSKGVVRTIPAAVGGVPVTALAGTGNRLWCASTDSTEHTIYVYDLHARTISHLRDLGVACQKIIPTDRDVTAVGVDGTMVWYDRRTGKKIGESNNSLTPTQGVVFVGTCKDTSSLVVIQESKATTSWVPTEMYESVISTLNHTKEEKEKLKDAFDARLHTLESLQKELTGTMASMDALNTRVLTSQANPHYAANMISNTQPRQNHYHDPPALEDHYQSYHHYHPTTTSSTGRLSGQQSPSIHRPSGGGGGSSIARSLISNTLTQPQRGGSNASPSHRHTYHQQSYMVMSAPTSRHRPPDDWINADED